MNKNQEKEMKKIKVVFLVLFISTIRIISKMQMNKP